MGPDKFEIVAPPLSILAEPPVAVVDKVVDKKGTRALAEAYLQFLLFARKARRSPHAITTARAMRRWPRSTKTSFAKVELFTIDDVFGGWTKAQKEHFADGGVFDQIYKN